jgi:hypothetical protein
VPTQWDGVPQDNHQENTDNINQMFRTKSVKLKTVKMKHEEKYHIKTGVKIQFEPRDPARSVEKGERFIAHTSF